MSVEIIILTVSIVALMSASFLLSFRYYAKIADSEVHDVL